MKRLGAAAALAVGFYLPFACAADAPEPNPAVANERVVFTTDHGDLVFALYPDVAPRHVEHFLKLVRLGAYDTTHAFRIIPNFIVQFSDVRNRSAPLSPEQYAADVQIPGEFSTTLRHARGILSMARWDDPNSATSSFSIMLGNAPHLDGKYTIFGHLESGGTVVNRLLGVPRDGEAPKVRINVRRARVISDIEAYYKQYPRDPIEDMGNAIPQELPQEVAKAATEASDLASVRWVAYLVVAMVTLSLLSFALYERLDKRQLLSLHMLNVLIGAFVLFVIMVPIGHTQPWVAGVIFIMLPLLFKFMNRFESGK